MKRIDGNVEPDLAYSLELEIEKEEREPQIEVRE